MGFNLVSTPNSDRDNICYSMSPKVLRRDYFGKSFSIVKNRNLRRFRCPLNTGL